MINLSKGQRGYIYRFGQVRFKGAKNRSICKYI